MKYISELSGILSQRLNWHKSRIDCFAQMLLALFMVRSVNLSEIAVAMDGDRASIDSRYKRVYRFFSKFEVDFTWIARWIYSLFFNKAHKVYLAIDRTNWYWGKAKINVFMLSICYEGIAIPIFWRLLKKAGSTTGKEQIELLSRFINTFGKESIQGILGDREFPNKALIAWLVAENIPFYLRIKGNVDVCIGKKKFKASAQLFSHLAPYQHQVFGMKVHVFGHSLYLAGSKNSREDLMIVITNQPPKNAIACYLRRWEIETLFASLKTKGWRFEDTRVIEPKRIEKLLVLLALGFVWAHRIGEWKASIKPIPLKKLRNQKRPKNSFFRLGLDHLRDLLTNHRINIKLFAKLSNWILFALDETVF
ncbi:transposase [Legionella taurinensis]|nr:IS4 family transposase [Legionella taurinensis]STY26235.1 transposase [Legionella taurinensis]STY26613.1 transposase [Legionella taurinensis]